MHKVGAGSMVWWSNAGTSSESSTAPAADTLDEPAMVFPAVPIRDEIWPLNNEFVNEWPQKLSRERERVYSGEGFDIY